MRTTLLQLATPAGFAVFAAPVAAQEAAARPSLLSPSGGLMFWTLIVFVVLWVVLSKFAFGPLTKAVAAREQALQQALEDARRDREEAGKLLEEQRRAIESARAEAQHFITDARAAGDRLRDEMLERTRQEQQELLERARREIGSERDRAIAELRREAVDLAIRGASKVIERNLDDAANRQIVETFLGSLDAPRSASR
ncbi:MAG: F0F1 ATP synthase subunit B [Gemmatimonadaceae bacterium]